MTTYSATLNNPNFVNNFNAADALKGAKVLTRSGHPARVICKCDHGTKLFVQVETSPFKGFGTYTMKVNLNGKRYADTVDHIDDLMLAI